MTFAHHVLAPACLIPRVCPQLDRFREMLRIFSAASGEEVVTLDAGDVLMAQEGGCTVGAVKRHLSKHHLQSYSRFQIRILRQGDPNELLEDLGLTPPADLQLLLLEHLPSDEERDWQFLDSCEGGQAEEVEKSLRALQNPDVIGDEGDDAYSALFIAAGEGHGSVVELLLEARANSEWSNPTGYTPLFFAAEEGHAECVRLLLEFGVEKEAVASSLGGARPFHLAAFEGHNDVVAALLDFAADMEAVDDRGLQPLHDAASRGHVEIIRRLLERRAQLETADLEGFTALHWAAQKGSVDAAKVLLESKADQDLQGLQGEKALHLAARGGHQEVLRFFLDSQGDLQAADRLGSTALHCAAGEGHELAVHLLLDYLADQLALDSKGRTAAQVAREEGHEAVTQLLEAGAKRRRLDSLASGEMG